MPAVIKRLKRWRAANKLSQRQAFDVMAARGLPISFTSLTNYEGGFRSPGAAAAYAIARFLDDNPTITDAKVYTRRDPLPYDKVAEILALREQGWELLKIAEKFGISGSAVSRYASGNRRQRKSDDDSGQNQRNSL